MRMPAALALMLVVAFYVRFAIAVHTELQKHWRRCQFPRQRASTDVDALVMRRDTGLPARQRKVE